LIKIQILFTLIFKQLNSTFVPKSVYELLASIWRSGQIFRFRLRI